MRSGRLERRLVDVGLSVGGEEWLESVVRAYWEDEEVLCDYDAFRGMLLDVARGYGGLASGDCRRVTRVEDGAMTEIRGWLWRSRKRLSGKGSVVFGRRESYRVNGYLSYLLSRLEGVSEVRLAGELEEV